MRKWIYKNDALALEVVLDMGFWHTVAKLNVNAVCVDQFKFPSAGFFSFPPCLCASVDIDGAKFSIEVFFFIRAFKPCLRSQIYLDRILVAGDLSAKTSNFERKEFSQMNLKEMACAYFVIFINLIVIWFSVLLLYKIILSFSFVLAMNNFLNSINEFFQLHVIIVGAYALGIFMNLHLFEGQKTKKMSEVISVGSAKRDDEN